MAVAHRASIASGSTNPTTSFTITIPASTQTDDILIVSVTARDNVSDPTVTDNDTGGNTWTKIGGPSTSTVWWKRATSGTASKTITVASAVGSSSGGVSVWSGATKNGTPVFQHLATGFASGVESVGSIIPYYGPSGSALIFALANTANDNAVTVVSSSTIGAFTQNFEKLSTGGNDCANTQWYKIISNNTGTGTITWAQTNGATYGFILEIIPERSPSVVPNTGEVDSYGFGNADVSFSMNVNNIGYGQTITGNGTAPNKAILYLKKTGSPTGNAVAKIYAISGTHGTSGAPTGAALATSNNLDVSTLTTNISQQTFTFSSPATLTLGTNYILTVEYSNDGTFANTVEVAVDASSPTHSGNYAACDGVWVGASNADLAFELYVDPYATSDTTPTLEFTGTDPDSSDIRYNIQIGSASFSSVEEHSYSYDNFSQGSTFANGTVAEQGQSFLTVAGGTLSVASFQLTKVGSPSGNLVAKIYAHSGTLGTSSVGTGAVLATSDPIDASSVPAFPSYANYDFVFSSTNRITLSATTNYVIAIGFSGTSDASNRFLAATDATSPTHSGNRTSLSTGAVWTASSGEDLCFSVQLGPIEIHKVSNLDAGFADVTNGADSDPFASGDKVSYTVQSALAAGTYYWRVRGIDPSGTNTYGAWSSTRSFTVSTGGGALTPSVNDSITVTENVSVLIPTLVPSVNDAVTITESVTLRLTSYPSVSDTVTLTENLNFTGTISPVVNDTVNVTEDVQLRLTSRVSVNDNITVVDAPTVLIPTLVPSVFDSVTLTEQVTVRVNAHPSVSDLVTIAENTSFIIATNASVNDQITVSEDVQLRLTSYPSVQDTITVADVPSQYIPTLHVSVNDTVTALDVPVMTGTLIVSEVETVTLTEDVSLLIPTLKLSVFDTVTATEQVSVDVKVALSVSDNATVAESVNTDLRSYISVVDNVSVTEHTALTIGQNDVEISVHDTVSVAEDTQVRLTSYIAVFDAVSLAEETSVRIPTLVPSVQDTVTTAEFTDLRLTSYISVNDQVTTTENLSFTGQSPFSVNDSVTVSDVPAVLIPTLHITVDDSVNVLDVPVMGSALIVFETEDITVEEALSFTGTSQVSVNDEVTVSEDVQLRLVSYISETEDITVTEAVSGETPFNISVSDEVTVVDFPGYYPDIIFVTEYVRLEFDGSISVPVNDTVTVSESVSLLIPTLVPAVNEQVTVTEATSFSGQSQISVNDQITVSESVDVRIPVRISVADDVSVSEAVDLKLTSRISVFDSITVTENRTTNTVQNISVNDSVSLQDVLTHYDDLIIVQDVPIIRIDGIYNSSVTDQVSLAEDISIKVPTLFPIVNDTITVTDSPELFVTGNAIFVTDNVSVADVVITENNLTLSVHDSVTLTENTSLSYLEKFVEEFETVTVTENLTVKIAAQILSVSDSVAVAENLTLFNSHRNVSVNDSVTLEENVRAKTRGYRNGNRNVETYTNSSRHATSYSNTARNSTSFSNTPRTSTSYSNTPRNSETYNNTPRNEI